MRLEKLEVSDSEEQEQLQRVDFDRNRIGEKSEGEKTVFPRLGGVSLERENSEPDQNEPGKRTGRKADEEKTVFLRLGSAPLLRENFESDQNEFRKRSREKADEGKSDFLRPGSASLQRVNFEPNENESRNREKIQRSEDEENREIVRLLQETNVILNTVKETIGADCRLDVE